MNEVQAIRVLASGDSEGERKDAQDIIEEEERSIAQRRCEAEERRLGRKLTKEEAQDLACKLTEVHAREIARETLWQAVEHYVLHQARLPIGPLQDDDDVLRNIATNSMDKLFRDDYKALRGWLQRNRQRRDWSSWGGFLKVVVARTAIDAARGSDRNISTDRSIFIWVDVQATDPAKMPESSGDDQADGIKRARAEMHDILAAVNRRARMPREPTQDTAPPVRRRRRRSTGE